MKYLILIVLSFLLYFPVNAQTFEERREQMQQKQQEMIEKREENKEKAAEKMQQMEEKREQVSENVQNRLSNMVQNHINRLEKRFNMYNTRLSAIIGKMESNDVIIANTEAIDTLNTAKQDLQQANDMAKQTLDALKTIQSMQTIERSELEQAKTLAKQTVDMYKSVHSDLVSIVSLVRSN